MRGMKVAELIAELQRMPPYLEVRFGLACEEEEPVTHDDIHEGNCRVLLTPTLAVRDGSASKDFDILNEEGGRCRHSDRCMHFREE